MNETLSPTLQSNRLITNDNISIHAIENALSHNIDIACIMVVHENDLYVPYPIALPYIYGNESTIANGLNALALPQDTSKQHVRIDVLLTTLMHYVGSTLDMLSHGMSSPLQYIYWALRDFDVMRKLIDAICREKSNFEKDVLKFRFFDGAIKGKKVTVSQDTLNYLNENGLMPYRSKKQSEFLSCTYQTTNLFELLLALTHFIHSVTYFDSGKYKNIKLKYCTVCQTHFITHTSKTKYCNYTVIDNKTCAQRIDNSKATHRIKIHPIKKRLDRRLNEFKLDNEAVLICENITRADLYKKWVHVSGIYREKGEFDVWLSQAEAKLSKSNRKEERRQNYCSFYLWLTQQEDESYVC